MSVTFKGKPLIPSKYLEAADLQGKSVAVTIDAIVARVELKNPTGKDYRPMFKLRGKEKGWIMNKTNLKLIAEVFGSKADAWVGKTVVIHAARVESFGKTVDAIRVDVDATRARSEMGAGAEPAHDEKTGAVTADDRDELFGGDDGARSPAGTEG